MTIHPAAADDFEPVERFEKLYARVLVRDEQGDWDAYQSGAGDVYRTRLRPGTETPAFLAELATRHDQLRSAMQDENTRQATIDQLAAKAEGGTSLTAAEQRTLLAALARRRR